MSVLQRILETKRDEIASAMRERPLSQLRDRIAANGPVRGFRKALEAAAPKLALIAEVKAASPSQGAIRPELDPAKVAEAFAEAGASAISVLTDERYFWGSERNLVEARRATELPVLRKDFVIHGYQVEESRAMGADALLLIVAALERPMLEDLLAQTREFGMDALVEAHDEREAETALEIGADLIGVNNRDLSTLTTDLGVSERVLPLVAPHALAVSESALESRADLDRVQKAGARAVLIGTAFCSAPDIGAKVREVMGWE